MAGLGSHGARSVRDWGDGFAGLVVSSLKGRKGSLSDAIARLK